MYIQNTVLIARTQPDFLPEGKVRGLYRFCGMRLKFKWVIRDFKRNIVGKRDFIPSWEVVLIKIPMAICGEVIHDWRDKSTMLIMHACSKFTVFKDDIEVLNICPPSTPHFNTCMIEAFIRVAI
jgi:hypothetical protein